MLQVLRYLERIGFLETTVLVLFALFTENILALTCSIRQQYGNFIFRIFIFS